MIEIFPNSLLSLFVALIVKMYLLSKKCHKKIKVTLSYNPYNSHIPITYFIIKSHFLSNDQMNSFLVDIRQRSHLVNIIIIGSQINYEELFKNHYQILGVIDITQDKSWNSIKKQIYFYLDYLYNYKK